MIDQVVDVLAAHQLSEPGGGTATGSRCACTCGEVLRTPGDRDYVMTLGRRHVARALAEAGLLAPAPLYEETEVDQIASFGGEVAIVDARRRWVTEWSPADDLPVRCPGCGRDDCPRPRLECDQ